MSDTDAKRTVAIVRRGYSATGGAEAYLLRLAGGLRDSGIASVLYTSPDWPEDRWPFGPVVRIGADSPLGFARGFARARTPGIPVLSLERVPDCDLYRAGDGVHAAWLNRRAAVEPWWKRAARRFNPKHRQLLALERVVFDPARTGRIIVNSAMVKREIAAHYNFPETRVHLIRNGIPRWHGDRGQRTGARRELGLEDAEYVALFAGTGWERKGLRPAAEAVCRIGRMTLLVAGRGRPSVRTPAIKYLGPVVDMPRLFAAADVFILPTLYDPMSNACLEAVAAGLPVITTDANGAAEILEHGVTGSVVAAPASVGALAGALEFWRDPQAREHACAGCRKLAQVFSVERNVSETLHRIEETQKNL